MKSLRKPSDLYEEISNRLNELDIILTPASDGLFDVEDVGYQTCLEICGCTPTLPDFSYKGLSIDELITFVDELERKML